MRINTLHIISFFALLFITFSCTKKNTSSSSHHYEYFGLTHGRYIDYDVFEVVHDINAANAHDTSIYQLRTVIGDTIVDNTGRNAMEFKRYRKDSTNGTWYLIDIWSAIIDDNRGEIVEENQRKVKLGFPVHLQTTWKENSFNSNASSNEPEFYFTNIHVESTINSLDFDSTIHLEKESNLSFVNYEVHNEIYAKNVGLVRKYFKDLNINLGDTLNIKSGNELIYTCIGYGFE